MIVAFLIVVASCALLAYVPLVLVIIHRQRPARKRPVNEVLSEAVGQGRLSMEDFETMIDEVHSSMSTLDAPYPMVQDEGGTRDH